MELRDYGRVLRRSWLLVVICVVLGAVVAAIVTWRATKIYSTTVTMIVYSPGGADGPVGSYHAGQISQQQVTSFVDLVESERVSIAVTERLSLGMAASAIQDKIEAYAVPDTVLIRVTVTDPDPALARDIADAVGAVFSAAVANIEGTEAQRQESASHPQPAVRVSVWERAQLPTAPIEPRPLRAIALGLLYGLLAGALAVLVRQRLDAGVSGPDDASRVSGSPTLAAVAFDPDAARRPLIVQAGGHSPRVEAFRRLRANLRFVDVDAAPRSIVVTSSVAAEGKTSVACNLAITLAQSGSAVVLVEGDLRHSAFADFLGVESAAGLTSVLIGAADLDDVLWPWGKGRVGDGSLDVLPSGPVPPNPAVLLSSRGMADLLDSLARRFDFVIVDAPPLLLPAADAAVLAAQVDGVLLVTRVGRTRRGQLARAVQRLRAVEARVFGLVLSMVPAGVPGACHDSDHYSFAPRGRHARVGGAAASAVPAAPGTATPSAGLRQAFARGVWNRPGRRRSGAAGVPGQPVAWRHGSGGTPSGVSIVPTGLSGMAGMAGAVRGADTPAGGPAALPSASGAKTWADAKPAAGVEPGSGAASGGPEAAQSGAAAPPEAGDPSAGERLVRVGGVGVDRHEAH